MRSLPPQYRGRRGETALRAEIARGKRLELTENARVSTSICMPRCSRVSMGPGNERFTSTLIPRVSRSSYQRGEGGGGGALFNCKILRGFLRVRQSQVETNAHLRSPGENY